MFLCCPWGTATLIFVQTIASSCPHGWRASYHTGTSTWNEIHMVEIVFCLEVCRCQVGTESCICDISIGTAFVHLTIPVAVFVLIINFTNWSSFLNLSCSTETYFLSVLLAEQDRIQSQMDSYSLCALCPSHGGEASPSCSWFLNIVHVLAFLKF